MNEVKVIPTYEVVDTEMLGNGVCKVTLRNINNDFDVIRIKVPSYTSSMIFRGKNYSITTRTKRTWYTLWLGKKKEYHVLGNIDEEGKVLLTVNSEPPSDEALENFKKEWKKKNYNE